MVICMWNQIDLNQKRWNGILVERLTFHAIKLTILRQNSILHWLKSLIRYDFIRLHLVIISVSRQQFDLFHICDN